MAEVASAVLTITTTASLVVQADTDGCRVMLHHSGGGSVYLGGSDVTTSNGYQLMNADGHIELVLPPNATLYAVSAGSEPLQVLKVGQR